MDYYEREDLKDQRGREEFERITNTPISVDDLKDFEGLDVNEKLDEFLNREDFRTRVGIVLTLQEGKQAKNKHKNKKRKIK